MSRPSDPGDTVLKRDPILDDINRIDKHATWSIRLCILGIVLACAAVASLILGY